MWFETASEFEYFKDLVKTQETRSPDGTMSTIGDAGYADEDGYVYLTDRRTFMIISGGVNIYPQEGENLLSTHPLVADAAVFGVPNADLGEEVKAVVQPITGIRPDADLAEELIAFCREHLAHIKCPRSVDFEEELPRLPTGKLYKRLLRDRYGATERAISSEAEAVRPSRSRGGRRGRQILGDLALHRVAVGAESADENDRNDERQGGAGQRRLVGPGQVEDERARNRPELEPMPKIIKK